MVALTKINVKLHLTGLKFEQQQRLNFMGAILLDPTEGLNSIRTAWQLAQAKTNPLLEDCAAWQLVLQWVADDNLSFPNFLTEMQSNFKDRYKFDKWKTIFDQVFKASCNGTAVEVVRAAMTECGVLDRPSVHDLSLQASSSADISPTRPSRQASSSQPHKSMSILEFLSFTNPSFRQSLSQIQGPPTPSEDSDDDKSEHEGDRDSAVHHSPRGSDQQVEVPGIFLASYISPTTYTSQANDQVQHNPLANKNRLQPGDLVCVISSPHKDLCGMLHYYSSCELLVTPSMIQLKSTADLGDKGKSKAEEPDVTRGDSDVHEDSDLIQISVCMDDAVVIPLNTLQFSKEMGYNVTVSNHVRVACGPAVGVEGPVRTIDTIARCLTVLLEDGPWHDVPIGFCIKLQDYSIRDVECQVGHEAEPLARS
ncbi:hypothetical protein PISMIDRAFT_18184 [Pisolithus microcarpus 441]|uniref:Uncharacterized protein n=1 Tax=Pisolithus microcarpus 441 TaxID=765257 RepID=A0A0C9YH09_9AGAM|nr:hypothetical protein BKA83DRAFT_18184 [Pisolithus microcarpus]KIK13179.1 hypothetical protein PISMIDRAFT_18184 [Pisolithus microcarpus 441]